MTGGNLRHNDRFLHFVHESDLVPRLLLIKKGLYDKLAKWAKGSGLMKRAKELVTKAYDKLPWYIQLVGDIGQEAYNIYQGEDPNAEWFKYKLFGRYIFLNSGVTYPINDVEVASRWMRNMMPELGANSLAKSLADHSLSRYSEALEALRSETGPREEL